MKYLKAPSTDPSAPRLIAVSTYTASDITSSARKITSRSVAMAISIMPASANRVSASYSPPGNWSRSTILGDSSIVIAPITTRIMTTKSPKVSADTTPKPVAWRPHSSTVLMPAPARPTRPRPLIGMRSPGSRNASASMAAMPAAMTHRMGTMATMEDDDMSVLYPDVGRHRGAKRHVRTPGGRRTRHGFAAHPLEQAIDGWLHRTEEDAGQHAHEDGHGDDGDDHPPLADGQVRQGPVLVMGDRPVVHPLEHPQHVDGREDDAAGGERRVSRIPAEGAEQDQEFSDEAVQARQPDRRQRHQQEHGDQPRRDGLQAAELGDLPRVPAVGQHADDEEQAAGADAVIQHLINRALHPLHVQRADAQHDEAHVADARVGHQLLQVRLDHRHEGAVDNPDDGQQRERRREERGG